jgi:non-ribosomal peptide synthase protein (TIGR01720 family)/FkbM family methyltransferase
MYREIFEEKIYLQHGIRLNDGDCVFDVGANVGMFSLFVGRTCKNARIYAFEPIPPLYELLRTNAALYSLDAKLFNCGISAATTQAEFTYYPHLTLMSGRFADLAQDQEVVKLFELNRRRPEEATALNDELLDEVLTERMSSESFVCQLKRISDVMRDNQIKRIDLLKIDVQKSELDVLGGIDKDDWPKIKQIVLEVHDVDDRLRQIVSLLEPHGFQVTVKQETMLKETGLFDVYCVRPEPAETLTSHGDDEVPESLPAWTSPDALTGDIRDYLRVNLPDYMVPSAFVLLESMPLTANGKLDHRALPEPDEAGAEAGKAFAPPGNETEEILAGIWGQVLGLPRVGVNDNFFELGGDSILSIQIVARANQAGLKLSPKLLFRHQSVAELSAALSASGAATLPVAAEQGLLTGPLPLTPIQHYFFSQPLVAAHHFNQSLLLVVHRPLDVAVLQRALTALVSHHDALRLRFTRTETGWQQRYAGAEAVGEVAVREVDVSGVSREQQRAAIAEACDEAQRSMRLEEGGLMRVLLFETGGEQRLLIVAHHLVVDGVSWRVIVEDMGKAIEQIERGQGVGLGKKTSSYRRWSERLEEYEREELGKEAGYWRGLEAKEVKPIPVDFSEGLNTVESARTVSASLEAEETRALLQEVPEAYRTQINDVLLTGVVEAFGKWSGHRQVLIDMEGHGREELWEDIDLSRTVGWFTTLFPVAFQLNPATQTGVLLKAVKEQLRRVPNRGIGHSLLRYLSQDAEVSEALRALPQAEVRFNYLGQLDNVLPSNSLFSWSTDPVGAERDGRQLRAYLLDVTSVVSGGRLQLNVIYSENIHRRDTVEILSRGLLEALRAIIAHCRAPEAGNLSPSDFPLAKLSQQQLDRIMSKTTAGVDSNDN